MSTRLKSSRIKAFCKQ